MDAHDLSLVILNHNGGNLLWRCLHSLSQSHLTGVDIVVVDNASTDGSECTAEQWEVRLIRADNRYGFLTGLNTAFQATTRPWVGFLQNDVMVHDTTFVPFLYTPHPTDGILQLHLQNPDGSVNHIGGQYLWPGVGLGNRRLCPDAAFLPVDLFATAAFLMPRAIYERVGPFDIQFAPAYYEDVDYSLRCERLEIPRYVARDAIATHLSTYTFHRTHTKSQLSALCRKNRRYVVEKHFTGVNRMSRLAGLRVLDTITSDWHHGDTYRPSTP